MKKSKEKIERPEYMSIDPYEIENADGVSITMNQGMAPELNFSKKCELGKKDRKKLKKIVEPQLDMLNQALDDMAEVLVSSGFITAQVMDELNESKILYSSEIGYAIGHILTDAEIQKRVQMIIAAQSGFEGVPEDGNTNEETDK